MTATWVPSDPEIRELEIPTRAYSFLARIGRIQTLDDLCEFSRAELKAKSNPGHAGKKTLDSIEEALAKKGRSLKQV